MTFRHNRQWVIALGLAVVFLGLGCARTPGQINRRTASKLADRMLSAMGGQRALRDIRYLQFDYVIESQGHEVLRRTHLWDRETGDYRLEWHEGSWPVLVLFNINTGQGRAWRRLRPVEGQEADDLLRQAHAAYLNDTFWLLSVERLSDPAAQLAFDGENLVQGRLCPTLELWFKGGGPSPKDRYWFYIDSRTDQPFAWAYASDDPAAPTKTFLWKQWRWIGDFSLPTRFEPLEDSQTIRFHNLFAPGAISQRVFREP